MCPVFGLSYWRYATALLELEVTTCCGVRLCSTDVRWQIIRAAYYCLHVRNVRIIFYSMSIIIAILGNLQQLFIVPEHVIGNVHYIVCCGRCFGSELFAVPGSSPIFAVSTNLRSPRPMAGGCTMRICFMRNCPPLSSCSAATGLWMSTRLGFCGLFHSVPRSTTT